jgi:HAMP domain-containing protein
VNRLWVKLSSAFLAVSLVAIGIVAAFSARATGEQFRRYVVASGMAGQPAWADALIQYYAGQGSWEDVDQLLAQLGPGGMGMSQIPARGGMGRGRGNVAAGPNLAVADASGLVVASKTGELMGEQLPADVLAQGLPLTLNGQLIGTLLNVRPTDFVLDAQGQAFLRQVQTSLIWAALLAALLSLALGVLISRLLTAPLARLTRAAQAIERGDLQQHIAIRGRDEIGKLGTAFNSLLGPVSRPCPASCRGRSAAQEHGRRHRARVTHPAHGRPRQSSGHPGWRLSPRNGAGGEPLRRDPVIDPPGG